MNARQKRLFEEALRKNPNLKMPSEDRRSVELTEEDMAFLKQGVGDKTSRPHQNAAPAADKPTFLNQRRIFSDIASRVTKFAPGREVAPGIVTLPAPGHTPGHTVFAIYSDNQSLMVLSDTAQHPAIFARHPTWQAAFDVDGDAAVATRKKLFDRAAADRMLVTGYHFPFPACGHLVKTASGYEHVPAPWQPVL